MVKGATPAQYELIAKLTGKPVEEALSIQVASTMIDSLFAAEKAQKAAAKAAAMANVPAIEAGTYEVVGEVVGTKVVDGVYGTSVKVRFVDEQGRGFWCTRPKSVQSAVKGSVVAITATWTPSDNDPHFAFGKRPTGRLVEAFDGEAVSA